LWEEGSTVSQQTVGIVIETLLTDEILRSRFDADRIEVLAEIVRRGVRLTPHEIDLFLRSDARLWQWGSDVQSVCGAEDSARRL